MPIQQGGNGEAFDLDAWLEALSDQESGGDYGIQRVHGAGATGKYQVIKSNIPKWTKEVYGEEFTPDEFAATPELQEEVVRFKIQQYHQQRGGDLRELAKDWYGRGKTLPGHPTPDGYAASLISKYQKARQRRGAVQPAPQQTAPDAADPLANYTDEQLLAMPEAELAALEQQVAPTSTQPAPMPTTTGTEGDVSPDGKFKWSNNRWVDNTGQLPSQLNPAGVDQQQLVVDPNNPQQGAPEQPTSGPLPGPNDQVGIGVSADGQPVTYGNYAPPVQTASRELESAQGGTVRMADQGLPAEDAGSTDYIYKNIKDQGMASAIKAKVDKGEALTPQETNELTLAAAKGQGLVDSAGRGEAQGTYELGQLGIDSLASLTPVVNPDGSYNEDADLEAKYRYKQHADAEAKKHWLEGKDLRDWGAARQFAVQFDGEGAKANFTLAQANNRLREFVFGSSDPGAGEYHHQKAVEKGLTTGVFITDPATGKKVETEEEWQAIRDRQALAPTKANPQRTLYVNINERLVALRNEYKGKGKQVFDPTTGQWVTAPSEDIYNESLAEMVNDPEQQAQAGNEWTSRRRNELDWNRTEKDLTTGAGLAHRDTLTEAKRRLANMSPEARQRLREGKEPGSLAGVYDAFAKGSELGMVIDGLFGFDDMPVNNERDWLVREAYRLQGDVPFLNAVAQTTGLQQTASDYQNPGMFLKPQGKGKPATPLGIGVQALLAPTGLQGMAEWYYGKDVDMDHVAREAYQQFAGVVAPLTDNLLQGYDPRFDRAYNEMPQQQRDAFDSWRRDMLMPASTIGATGNILINVLLTRGAGSAIKGLSTAAKIGKFKSFINASTQVLAKGEGLGMSAVESLVYSASTNARQMGKPTIDEWMQGGGWDEHATYGENVQKYVTDVVGDLPDNFLQFQGGRYFEQLGERIAKQYGITGLKAAALGRVAESAGEMAPEMAKQLAQQKLNAQDLMINGLAGLFMGTKADGGSHFIKSSQTGAMWKISPDGGWSPATDAQVGSHDVVLPSAAVFGPDVDIDGTVARLSGRGAVRATQAETQRTMGRQPLVEIGLNANKAASVDGDIEQREDQAVVDAGTAEAREGNYEAGYTAPPQSVFASEDALREAGDRSAQIEEHLSTQGPDEVVGAVAERAAAFTKLADAVETGLLGKKGEAGTGTLGLDGTTDIPAAETREEQAKVLTDALVEAAKLPDGELDPALLSTLGQKIAELRGKDPKEIVKALRGVVKEEAQRVDATQKEFAAPDKQRERFHKELGLASTAVDLHTKERDAAKTDAKPLVGEHLKAKQQVERANLEVAQAKTAAETATNRYREAIENGTTGGALKPIREAMEVAENNLAYAEQQQKAATSKLGDSTKAVKNAERRYTKAEIAVAKAEQRRENALSKLEDFHEQQLAEKEKAKKEKEAKEKAEAAAPKPAPAAPKAPAPAKPAVAAPKAASSTAGEVTEKSEAVSDRKTDQVSDTKEPAKPKGRTIRVNDTDVELDAEQSKAYDKAEAQYKAEIAHADNPVMDKVDAAKRKKAAGFRFAAQKRVITDQLTAKERQAQQQDADKINVGKKVTVQEGGQTLEGVVATNPVYGRVGVMIDGEQSPRNFLYGDVTLAGKELNSTEYGGEAPLSPTSTSMLDRPEGRRRYLDESGNLAQIADAALTYLDAAGGKPAVVGLSGIDLQEGYAVPANLEQSFSANTDESVALIQYLVRPDVVKELSVPGTALAVWRDGSGMRANVVYADASKREAVSFGEVNGHIGLFDIATGEYAKLEIGAIVKALAPVIEDKYKQLGIAIDGKPLAHVRAQIVKNVMETFGVTPQGAIDILWEEGLFGINVHNVVRMESGRDADGQPIYNDAEVKRLSDGSIMLAQRSTSINLFESNVVGEPEIKKGILADIEKDLRKIVREYNRNSTNAQKRKEILAAIDEALKPYVKEHKGAQTAAVRRVRKESDHELTKEEVDAIRQQIPPTEVEEVRARLAKELELDQFPEMTLDDLAPQREAMTERARLDALNKLGDIINALNKQTKKKFQPFDMKGDRKTKPQRHKVWAKKAATRFADDMLIDLESFFDDFVNHADKFRDIDRNLLTPESAKALINRAFFWYTEGVKVATAHAARAFPELGVDKHGQPKDKFATMAFHTLLGMHSPGTDPASNSVAAVNHYYEWTKLRKEAIARNENPDKILLPMVDEAAFVRVPGKIDGKEFEVEVPGGAFSRAGHNTVIALNALATHQFSGDIKKAFEWLHQEHPIAEIRKAASYSKQTKLDLPDTPTAVGSLIFGAKVGAFVANVHGNLDYLTADLWFTRSWNRGMGTLQIPPKSGSTIGSEPRHEDERRAMRLGTLEVAKRLEEQWKSTTKLGKLMREVLGTPKTVSMAEAQSILWYMEQQIWARQGGLPRSQSFEEGTKNHTDNWDQKVKDREETRKAVHAAMLSSYYYETTPERRQVATGEKMQPAGDVRNYSASPDLLSNLGTVDSLLAGYEAMKAKPGLPQKPKLIDGKYHIIRTGESVALPENIFDTEEAAQAKLDDLREARSEFNQGPVRYEALLIQKQRITEALIANTGLTVDQIKAQSLVRVHQGALLGIAKTLYQPQGQQRGQTREEQINSPEFKAWFRDSKVVGSDGKPLVVYHGTVTDFDSFSRGRSNPESDLGAGFYFTNDTYDASGNYGGFGPDITNKAEKLAERIVDDGEVEEYSEALKLAKQRLSDHGGAVMPVYLSIQNPFQIGSGVNTVLDFEQEYDEQGDPVGEPTGKLVDFIDALREISSDYIEGDVEPLIAELYDWVGGEGGITGRKLYERAKHSSELQEFIDPDGDGESQGMEIFRGALEAIGFDGIMDYTVGDKFSKMMANTGADHMTVEHYVAFSPTQIKSAVGNTGAFDPNNPSILYQPAPKQDYDVQAELQRIALQGGTPTDQALVAMLAMKPEYIPNVAAYLLKQRSKLLAGKMSPRDVAKALILTRASIGAGEIDLTTSDATFDAAGLPDSLKGSKDIGNMPASNFQTIAGEKSMIRPEDQMAKFLFTPQGQELLDHLEQVAAGKVELDRSLFDKDGQIAAARIRYGRVSTVTDMAKESGKTKVTKYNMDNLGDLTKAINEAGKSGDMEALGKVLMEIDGIGTGKVGFISQLLGFGGESTIDTVEISTWLFGKKEMPSDPAGKALHNYASSQQAAPIVKKLVKEGFARLAASPGIAAQLTEAEMDPQNFETIFHHWFWDRAKGTETSHKGLYDAMELAQKLLGSQHVAGRVLGYTRINAMQPSTIGLFQGANPATLLHEDAHGFRRFMNAADMAISTDWVEQVTGVKVENGEWQVAHEEAFARGFEQWLLEGRLPADAPKALKGVFQRLKQLILDSYKESVNFQNKGTVDDFVGPLTDPMRGVFERMIGYRADPMNATEQAIHNNLIAQNQEAIGRDVVPTTQAQADARDMMLSYCRWDFRRMPIADQRALLQEIFEVQRDRIEPLEADTVLGPVFGSRLREFKPSKMPANGMAALQRRLTKRLREASGRADANARALAAHIPADAVTIVEIDRFAQHAFNAMYPHQRVAKRRSAFLRYAAVYHPEYILNLNRARATLAGLNINDVKWRGREARLRELVANAPTRPMGATMPVRRGSVTLNSRTTFNLDKTRMEKKLTIPFVKGLLGKATTVPAQKLKGIFITPKTALTTDEFEDAGLQLLIDEYGDGDIPVREIAQSIKDHAVTPKVVVVSGKDAENESLFLDVVSDGSSELVRLTRDHETAREQLNYARDDFYDSITPGAYTKDKMFKEVFVQYDVDRVWKDGANLEGPEVAGYLAYRKDFPVYTGNASESKAANRAYQIRYLKMLNAKGDKAESASERANAVHAAEVIFASEMQPYEVIDKISAHRLLEFSKKQEELSQKLADLEAEEDANSTQSTFRELLITAPGKPRLGEDHFEDMDLPGQIIADWSVVDKIVNGKKYLYAIEQQSDLQQKLSDEGDRRKLFKKARGSFWDAPKAKAILATVPPQLRRGVDSYLPYLPKEIAELVPEAPVEFIQKALDMFEQVDTWETPFMKSHVSSEIQKLREQNPEAIKKIEDLLTATKKAKADYHAAQEAFNEATKGNADKSFFNEVAEVADLGGAITNDDGRKLIQAFEQRDRTKPPKKKHGETAMRMYLNRTEEAVATIAEIKELEPELYKTIEAAYKQVSNEWAETQRKLDNQGAVNIPFKRTWRDLATKTLIQYATENGYDGIIMPSGEFIGQRWGDDAGKRMHYNEKLPVSMERNLRKAGVSYYKETKPVQKDNESQKDYDKRVAAFSVGGDDKPLYYTFSTPYGIGAHYPPKSQLLYSQTPMNVPANTEAEEALQKVLDYFGTTENIKEAGMLHPDGAAIALFKTGFGMHAERLAQSGVDNLSLQDFITETGAARISSDGFYLNVESGAPLTRAQAEALEDQAYSHREVRVDFHKIVEGEWPSFEHVVVEQDDAGKFLGKLRRAEREAFGHREGYRVLYSANPPAASPDDIIAAAEELAAEFERVERASVVSIIGDIRKSMMLTSPKTHLRNLVGNLGFQAAEEFSRFPAVMFDVLASLRYGQRSITANQIDTAKAVFHTFTNRNGETLADKGGITRAFEAIMGVESTNTQTTDNHHGWNRDNRAVQILEKINNVTFKLLSAEDALFNAFALRRALLDMARVAVKNKEAKTQAEYMNSLTDDQIDLAYADALFATFNNSNRVSTWISSLKREMAEDPDLLGQSTRLALDMLVPFDRTPMNILARIVDYTPVGLAIGSGGRKETEYLIGRRREEDGGEPNGGGLPIRSSLTGKISQAEAIRARGEFMTAFDKHDLQMLQKEMAKQTGRGVVGTIIMMGAALGAKGLLRGFYGDDEEEWIESWGDSYRIKANGKPDDNVRNDTDNSQRNSVNIGGTWYSIDTLAPIGPLLILGATIRESMDKGDTWSQTGFTFLAEAARQVANMPVVRGFTDLGKASEDAEDKGPRFLGRMAASFIPSIVRDIADFKDTKERQVGSGLQGVVDTFKMSIPGQLGRESLPVKRDFLGRELPQKGGLEAIFDLFRSRESRSSGLDANSVGKTADKDPVFKELDKWDITLTKPAKEEGESEEDYNIRVTVVGNAAYRALQAEVGAERYKAMAGLRDAKGLNKQAEQLKDVIETAKSRASSHLTRILKDRGKVKPSEAVEYPKQEARAKEAAEALKRKEEAAAKKAGQFPSMDFDLSAKPKKPKLPRPKTLEGLDSPATPQGPGAPIDFGKQEYEDGDQ